jgi:hypothetical protein
MIKSTHKLATVIYYHCQLLCSGHNCICYTFTLLATQLACLHQHYHKHVSMTQCHDVTTATSLGLGNFLFYENLVGLPLYSFRRTNSSNGVLWHVTVHRCNT